MNPNTGYFQLGYGTTENSPVTFCGHPLDNEYRKAETVGYIMDHIEVRLRPPYWKQTDIHGDDVVKC